MTCPVGDREIQRYREDGVLVLRAILPASLVRDLRALHDRVRELARGLYGAQAQRLQPLLGHDLDHRPVRDYLELPALRDAVHRLLGPQHRHGTEEALGMLIEPGQAPCATGWHRDWRDHSSIPHERWLAVRDDLDLFNQVNCALYEDGCTWVVPGSHRREDLPGERTSDAPPLDGLDAVDAERAVRAHCEAMPGAVRLHLGAGDCAVYRNSMWHLGAYLPYQPRATLHDFVETPRYHAWRAAVAAAA